MPIIYTTDMILDRVMDVLADFLQPFCLDAEIIRAQTNRTPLPVGEFVVLTEILSKELSRPRTSIVEDAAGVGVAITSPARLDIQVDFYGPNAGDQCRTVLGVLRTEYACAQFPGNIQPLYASDGLQSPMINGENQWQTRWTMTLSLQIDPTVVVPAQSAVVLDYSLNP